MGNQQINGSGAHGAPPSGDDPRQQVQGGQMHGYGHAANTGYNTPHSYGGQGGGTPGGASHMGYHGGSGGAGGPPMHQRSGSDTSMTILDGDKTLAAVSAGSSSSSAQAVLESWMDDDTVPTVFRWEHGGRQVYITGTFNGWSRQIPMHRSGNDFTYIHNLKRGKHAFKFIVDDEWRFAPDQPTVADIEGRINNFIDVTDFKAYTGDREFEKEKAAAEYGTTSSTASTAGTTTTGTGADGETIGEASGDNIGTTSTTNPDGSRPTATDGGGGGGGGAGGASSAGDPSSDGSDGMGNRPDKDGEIFSQTMPDLDDYTKEPPPLPPHLRHIILNKPPQLQDTAALPVPQHVALNHLYCTAIKDNMMVLGITQRFKTKFVTTVYYSPCASK